MYEHCTEKELKARLKRLTVLVDTREQNNKHLIGYFDKNKIPYLSRKLDVGDYSFEIDGKSFDDEIVIEKKNSIEEIAGNFTADRLRFENEFLRAKAKSIKVFLLIENCSWNKIRAHEYRSNMNPKALVASLLSWQVRYGITVNFCESEDTAELIYDTLYYWARERIT